MIKSLQGKLGFSGFALILTLVNPSILIALETKSDQRLSIVQDKNHGKLSRSQTPSSSNEVTTIVINQTTHPFYMISSGEAHHCLTSYCKSSEKTSQYSPTQRNYPAGPSPTPWIFKVKPQHCCRFIRTHVWVPMGELYAIDAGYLSMAPGEVGQCTLYQGKDNCGTDTYCCK